ncbi:MAG: pirin family protein [Candidatus Acidiferrales bacterium]|jgi:redox-sensitive bicupin YhaK (pirin superfamily)
MITVRKSEDRGHAKHGWLDSRHTFSFADYQDPQHMGFRSLRVINEDRVAPGRGFGAHAHRDMEILSYVLEGKLVHKDSMGHEEQLSPNEIQRMSAGSGIIHSEFNGSATEPVHFLQIWIEPKSTGGAPVYEQLRLDPTAKRDRLMLIAGPDRVDGTAQINQDARVFVTEVSPGHTVAHNLQKGRYAWVQVVQGAASVNGAAVTTGDAVALSMEEQLTITGEGSQTSELLIFDLN